MKKTILIILVAFVAFAANSKEKPDTIKPVVSVLGKEVIDTTITIDPKFQYFVQSIEQGQKYVQQIAANEQEKQGVIKNKNATANMLADVAQIIQSYQSDFIEVDISTHYIDTIITKDQLSSYLQEIKRLNKCTSCDSVQVLTEVKKLEQQVEKLDKWLRQ